MKKLLLFLALIFLPVLPRASNLEPLEQNGAALLRGEMAYPLHCLSAPQFLSMTAEDQDNLCNRAAAAGFNAVAFDLPLFGKGGIFPDFEGADGEAMQNLMQAFQKLDRRMLYAFPTLWTPWRVREFEEKGNGKKGSFWTGTWAGPWQEHMLQMLTKALDDEGESLAAQPLIGGWVMYEGDLPEATDDFQAWLIHQQGVLKDSGAGQLCGLKTSASQGERKAMLSLQKLVWRSPLDFIVMDPGQPASEAFHEEMKDWQAGVGLPFIWALDWSALSMGERTSFLDPEGLAGTWGPWPLASSPETPTWTAPAVIRHGKPRLTALRIRQPELLMSGKDAVLTFLTNRPAVIQVHYGKEPPLSLETSQEQPSITHEIVLPGVKEGQRVLVRINASSEKWGQAALKATRLKAGPD